MFLKQKIIQKSKKIKKMGLYIVGSTRALECVILHKDLLQKTSTRKKVLGDFGWRVVFLILFILRNKI